MRHVRHRWPEEGGAGDDLSSLEHSEGSQTPLVDPVIGVGAMVGSGGGGGQSQAGEEVEG